MVPITGLAALLIAALQTLDGATLAAMPGTAMTPARVAEMGLTPRGGYCSTVEETGCCYYNEGAWSECLFADGGGLGIAAEGTDIYHVEVDVSRAALAAGDVHFTPDMSVYDAVIFMTSDGRRSAEVFFVASESVERLILHANDSFPRALRCQETDCSATLEFGPDGRLRVVAWSIHVF